MKQTEFPSGWNLERVRKVLMHYESQSEEEVIAEDEAAFGMSEQAVMEMPAELVSDIRGSIAGQNAA